jgi:hypothetical protein
MSYRRLVFEFTLTFIAIAVIGNVTTTANEQIAIPVDGQSFVGTVSQFVGDGIIKFDTEDGPREVAASDLVRWGIVPALSRGPLIVLANGSVLVADVKGIENSLLTAESFLFGEFRLPMASVRGIVFRVPADGTVRFQELQNIKAAKGSRDQLLFENGDRLDGVLLGGGRESAQGPTTHEVIKRLESLRMHTEAGDVDIPIDRITSIVFNPSLVEDFKPNGLQAWFGFREDGLLLVEKIEPSANTLTLGLPGRIELQTDVEVFRETLQFVQPLGGRAVYLSDLSPVGYRHIPYLSLEWRYGEDQNVLGGPLMSKERNFLKGLGMHSTSRLAYRLDRAYERFEAELALDDRAGEGGSVVYRVYTMDDSNAWKSIYESPIVRGGDAPLPISVSLEGARGIALIADFSDRGDVQDYANWLDARLE